jgi:hypothetical protein
MLLENNAALLVLKEIYKSLSPGIFICYILNFL